jgi:hypothetical protein
MPDQHISPREPSVTYRLVHTAHFKTLASISFYIFLAITAMALFIPLEPGMPSKGLDSSWVFAMNEAVARHLRFGKEIMFTFGPYASICTGSYHPATALRMICGSLLLGVSYITALLFLARGRKRYLTFFLLLFLATFGFRELLLLSYSFLLAMCVLKQTNSDDLDKAAALSWRKILAVVVMWSALGFLPLIKGSLLLPFAASVAIPSAFLLYRARFRLAILLLLTPVAATFALWALAGQSLTDLPAFLRGTFSLTSGYTEAMSTSWTILPGTIGNGLIIVSLAVSALIVLSIVRTTKLRVASKWMLCALFALFLLTVFKHGFVKVDVISTVFSSLAVLIMIILFVYRDRYLIWSLCIVVAFTATTSVCGDGVLHEEVHKRFGMGVTWSGESRSDIFAFCLERAAEAYARSTYMSTWDTYSGMWNGLRSRLSQGSDLKNQFEGSLADIRSEYPLPALKGTADIYTYDQSVLVATNIDWNPRPVFQSYSAYTPVLARQNEEHLRGPDAPDWVLFDLETIEGRLPSLDDGLSWPALFDNYTFSSYNGQVVLMRKNQLTRANSNYDDVYEKSCKTGATVALPETDGPLFAEVDLEPTLAGRLLTVLFKPPQLRIVLGLANGTTRRYRVVPNMMKTGFLLSPLVSNTNEFASLVNGINGSQEKGRVESISIAPSYGGSLFWSDTYALTLKKYVRE